MNFKTKDLLVKFNIGICIAFLVLNLDKSQNILVFK